MIDVLMYELLGSYSDPTELVCKFFFIMLIFDGIFGTVTALLKPLTDRR